MKLHSKYRTNQGISVQIVGEWLSMDHHVDPSRLFPIFSFRMHIFQKMTHERSDLHENLICLWIMEPQECSPSELWPHDWGKKCILTIVGKYNETKHYDPQICSSFGYSLSRSSRSVPVTLFVVIIQNVAVFFIIKNNYKLNFSRKYLLCNFGGFVWN